MRAPGRRLRLTLALLAFASSVAAAGVFFVPLDRLAGPARQARVAPPTARPDAAGRSAGAPAPQPVPSYVFGVGGPPPTAADHSAPDASSARHAKAVFVASRSVDARPLLAGWSGLTGWLRTRWFGFGPGALPLAGSVWLPPAPRAAPAPLVVVVHGNHPMERPSHEGFAYLCQGLARAGYACAAVDHRFLNASYVADAFGGLRGDRVVRSWLVLEQLALFRAWSHTPGHPLERAFDLEAVSLVGHSRGGAVVAMAAEWNRLGEIPGAPQVALPGRFGIRAVAGLAPIEVQRADGMGDHLPVLDGVGYLVIHGGRDADIHSFEGALQYDRVRAGGAGGTTKASVYLHEGNHNHFNTAWEPGDKPLLLAPLVDRRGVLAGDAQRAITLRVLRWFLDAVHRAAPASALPRLAPPDGVEATVRFRDARSLELADFDEDADPRTATWPGARLHSAGMAVAREEHVEQRWTGTYSTSRALRLAWASPAGAEAPRLVLRLPDGARVTGERDALLLDLALDPRHPAGAFPVSVAVELVDAAGRRARAGPVRVDLPGGRLGATGGALYHAALLEPPPEIVFGTHVVPLARLATHAPGFDASRLREVHLVPEDTPEGVLLVDGIAAWRAP